MKEILYFIPCKGSLFWERGGISCFLFQVSYPTLFPRSMNFRYAKKEFDHIDST